MPTGRGAQITKPTDQKQTESSAPEQAEFNDAELAKVTGGTLADVGKQIAQDIKDRFGHPVPPHFTTLNWQLPKTFRFARGRRVESAAPARPAQPETAWPPHGMGA
jgi:hypothetical protein